MTERRPYDSRYWRALRLRVLQRDQYVCQIKLPKCRTQARAVDHIIDWRDGGSWYDLSNLRAACGSCNSALRNQRVAERARQLRDLTQGGNPVSKEPPRRLTSRAW